MSAYPLRAIARRAGVSVATVDRVLHGRGGVRASTVCSVRQAVDDLRRTDEEVGVRAPAFTIDVVLAGASRELVGLRAAFEREMVDSRPTGVRFRVRVCRSDATDDVAAELDRPRVHRSHGVVLVAPDAPQVVDAVARLTASDVPVVTLSTDLPTSARLAHVGLDDAAAGATAAYLVGQWLRREPGDVLVVTSPRSRSEEEREMGFRKAMRRFQPARAVIGVTVARTDGERDGKVVRDALRRHPPVAAVYATGGDGPAVTSALEAVGHAHSVSVAHDVHEENRRLLVDGRLSALLARDLGADVRHAWRTILQYHRVLPGPPRSRLSQVQIVTPCNLAMPDPVPVETE